MNDPREKALAELCLDLEGLKAERREIAKEFRDRIGEKEAAIERLALDIRSGQSSLLDPIETAVANLAPKPGSGVTSVSLEVDGKPLVTLTQEDHERLAKRKGTRAS